MSVKIEVSDEVINADAITLCNPLAVKKAVVIPENPTNGDVIKSLFPNELLTSITSTLWWGDNMSFNKDWWNAPYKAERSGSR